MSDVSHGGQGPFGPVRTFVTVVDGQKQVPRSLLRYLCTTTADAEGQYGEDATPAQRLASEARVVKRMEAFMRRFPQVRIT